VDDGEEFHITDVSQRKTMPTRQLSRLRINFVTALSLKCTFHKKKNNNNNNKFNLKMALYHIISFECNF
jgi:hypothetical protein